MTEDEYNKGLCAIKDEYQQKRDDLSNRFIQSNHRFEIDDIIEEKHTHRRVKVVNMKILQFPFSGEIDIRYFGYMVLGDNVDEGKWGAINQKDAELVKGGE
jgi:hypothetical protein